MVLDRVSAALFRTLSAGRAERVFHPQGVAYEGRFLPRRDAQLLASSRLLATEHDAIVRFSRGVGLPAGTPDILGLAVKVLDVHGPGADQDLALASSGRSRVGRRLLVPRTDFAGTAFSSILPYDVDGRRVVIMASLVDSDRSLPFLRLSEGSAASVELRFWLEPGDVTVGRLRLRSQLDASASRDLRFDPWHTGPELRPAGLVNRLRRPTYRASQEGRDAPADGIRRHLDR